MDLEYNMYQESESQEQIQDLCEKWLIAAILEGGSDFVSADIELVAILSSN